MKPLSPIDLATRTLSHYEASPEQFWEGTKDHDVSQNYEALLSALPKTSGLRILDFGCGPGRDLLAFKNLGHRPVGLDGTRAFCEMAQAYSGCPVLHQNFLELDLQDASFDGIFANASLFHVPRTELTRVLTELRKSLVPGGILFSSNPRGRGEDVQGQRYANFMEMEEYGKFLKAAGFEVTRHYFRPPGVPPEEQIWLAVVARAGTELPR